METPKVIWKTTPNISFFLSFLKENLKVLEVRDKFVPIVGDELFYLSEH